MLANCETIFLIPTIFGPILGFCLLPICDIVTVTCCVSTHFMAHMPVLIDKTIVCCSLGQKMSCPNCATIRICVLSSKKLTVILLLSKSCESIVKSQVNNLWSMFSGVWCFGTTTVAISTTVRCALIWVTFFSWTIPSLSPNGCKKCKKCSYEYQSHSSAFYSLPCILKYFPNANGIIPMYSALIPH